MQISDGSKAYAKGIPCDPDDGWCPYEDMYCAGRYIVRVDEETTQYQKMVRVDPSFQQGETSYWCVTPATLDLGLKWNGKFNDAWGVEAKVWKIDEVRQPETASNSPVGSKNMKPGGKLSDSEGNIATWDDN